MAKGTEEMRKDLAFVRVYVDPEAVSRIGKIAHDEGRTQQRQMGIILENIAKLAREAPDKLRDLGLLTPASIVPRSKVA
jgi:hypothetical protein